MKKALFTILALSFLSTNCFADAQRFKYGRDWGYQPMIVNGETIFHTKNASGGDLNGVIQKRYAAMKPVLDRFGDKPIKVLDVGANNGYFSFNIAADYPNSHCVMIDCSQRLGDLCMANTNLNNITCMNTYLRCGHITELRKRERFDVILALFVLYHSDNWAHWLAEMKQMCKYLIVEIPSLDDRINQRPSTKALIRHILQNEKHEVLGRIQRQDTLDYLVLIPGNSSAPSDQLGIKPSTFTYLNGIFPNPEYISGRTGGKDDRSIVGVNIR